jgi:S-adenosylmethionine-diacylgycerolhomoserine-N-methlytransferase
MDPSISPTWRASADGAPDPFGVRTLERFYGWHALVYDWTRPLILFGRAALLAELDARQGQRILDVGCGTGWALPRLARRGAHVTGIECARPMLARARGRAERLRDASPPIAFDDRPYGSHGEYRGTADAIVFSYSLSMMPPFEPILASAHGDLRPGGQVAVVDFLEPANAAVGAWLSANHVTLGDARLRRLVDLFPRHRARVRRTPLWSYYLFWGSAD